MKALFRTHAYTSLEAPDVRVFAREDPREFLRELSDGAIIDEVQHVPELLSYIQTIVDENPLPGHWILTGSNNFSLLETVSQSLAGRTSLHQLLPLSWNEITQFAKYPSNLEEALYTGGYPRIFDEGQNPTDWLKSYAGTYLERDVRLLRNIGDLATFQRFLELCAGRSGCLLNYSSLASDCGISQPTAKNWVSMLETSYILFQLRPYYSNLRKRLVKMSKLYFYDTGLMCWLLGIRSPEHIRSHPLRGQIFETWAISEMVKHRSNLGLTNGLFFYRDHNGVEVDLVIPEQEKTMLIEAKSATTPSSNLLQGTKRIQRHFDHMSQVLDIAVVYGGDKFQKRDGKYLIPWRDLCFPWKHSRRIGIQGETVAISVSVGQQNTSGVQVLSLFPNKTWVAASTDDHGVAHLKLHSMDQPMVVYVAVEGYAAHLETDWIPNERDLSIKLEPLPGGGAVIFQHSTGYIPGLSGRLEPIRDPHDRTYLYAENIAINNGKQQPVDFSSCEKLHLMDAQGHECHIRVINITGQSSLLEFLPA